MHTQSIDGQTAILDSGSDIFNWMYFDKHSKYILLSVAPAINRWITIFFYVTSLLSSAEIKRAMQYKNQKITFVIVDFIRPATSCTLSSFDRERAVYAVRAVSLVAVKHAHLLLARASLKDSSFMLVVMSNIVFFSSSSLWSLSHRAYLNSDDWWLMTHSDESSYARAGRS